MFFISTISTNKAMYLPSVPSGNHNRASPSPEASKPFKRQPSSPFVRPCKEYGWDPHALGGNLGVVKLQSKRGFVENDRCLRGRAGAGPSPIASSFSHTDASESCMYFARNKNRPPCGYSCTVSPRAFSPNHHLFVAQLSFQRAEYVFICILLLDRHK